MMISVRSSLRRGSGDIYGAAFKQGCYVELRGSSKFNLNVKSVRKVRRNWEGSWNKKKGSPLSLDYWGRNWGEKYPKQLYDKIHAIEFHVHKGHKRDPQFERYNEREAAKARRWNRGFRGVSHW